MTDVLLISNYNGHTVNLHLNTRNHAVEQVFMILLCDIQTSMKSS